MRNKLYEDSPKLDFSGKEINIEDTSTPYGNIKIVKPTRVVDNIATEEEKGEPIVMGKEMTRDYSEEVEEGIKARGIGHGPA